MREARGLLFPSRWFEGFPMVYLEALAAGTPLIAWEPSVVAGLVREEGTGLVVDDLESALDQAEHDFPDMRKHCRSVFEARYTRESWTAALEGIFREVVRGATVR
jgi:glycosyltransferase involved in cell wall biosynthesis